jgi:hypothetical protein
MRCEREVVEENFERKRKHVRKTKNKKNIYFTFFLASPM